MQNEQGSVGGRRSGGEDGLVEARLRQVNSRVPSCNLKCKESGGAEDAVCARFGTTWEENATKGMGAVLQRSALKVVRSSSSSTLQTPQS